MGGKYELSTSEPKSRVRYSLKCTSSETIVVMDSFVYLHESAISRRKGLRVTFNVTRGPDGALEFHRIIRMQERTVYKNSHQQM